MLVTEQTIRGCEIRHCTHIEADAAQARASPQLLVSARLPAMNSYSGPTGKFRHSQVPSLNDK